MNKVTDKIIDISLLLIEMVGYSLLAFSMLTLICYSFIHDITLLETVYVFIQFVKSIGESYVSLSFGI